MNINFEKEITVFRYDGQYGASYSLGLSKKKQDGSYENGYMPCKFKKDIELENKTKIKIKNAWLTFNVKDKKTYPYIFINSFDIIGEQEEQKQDSLDKAVKEFKEETSTIELENYQLPF